MYDSFAGEVDQVDYGALPPPKEVIIGSQYDKDNKRTYCYRVAIGNSVMQSDVGLHGECNEANVVKGLTLGKYWSGDSTIYKNGDSKWCNGPRETKLTVKKNDTCLTSKFDRIHEDPKKRCHYELDVTHCIQHRRRRTPTRISGKGGETQDVVVGIGKTKGGRNENYCYRVAIGNSVWQSKAPSNGKCSDKVPTSGYNLGWCNSGKVNVTYNNGDSKGCPGGKRRKTKVQVKQDDECIGESRVTEGHEEANNRCVYDIKVVQCVQHRRRRHQCPFR